MSEQYGSWSIHFSREPIVEDQNEYHMSFGEFIKEDISVLLILVIPSVVFALIIYFQYGFERFFKQQRAKKATMIAQENHDNRRMKEEDSPTDEEDLPVEQESSLAEDKTS